jgi:hypothetical protein
MVGLKSDAVVRKSQRVVCETLEGEGLLLNLNDGNYFSLNEVGVDIWNHLEGDISIDDIASTIAKIYTTPYAQTLPDVTKFIAILLKRGLVELKA